MKVLIIFTAFLITGCVPIAKYKNLKSELVQVTNETSEMRSQLALFKKESMQLRKEIEKENQAITKRKAADVLAQKEKAEADRLAKIAADEKAERLLNPKAAGIKARLKKLNILTDISEDDLEGLTIAAPDKYPENYKWHMSHSGCRNISAAKDTIWLSKLEKETYYYLNYARVKPKEFCDKFLLPLLKQSYYKDNPCLITLIDYMYQMKPLNALTPNKKAFDMALCHAVSSGKTGYVGHDRKDCKKGYSAECCSYGTHEGLEAVLRLLIDESVPSLGHRYICLGYYSEVGIAYANHKRYGMNVVLDFF